MDDNHESQQLEHEQQEYEYLMEQQLDEPRNQEV